MKNLKKIYLTLTIILFTMTILNLSNAEVPDGMVLIPAGDGLEAFYMDKYEITNRQFKAFLDANPLWQQDKALISLVGDSYLSGWKNNMYPKGRADHPACGMSWFAAKAYAEWVGKDLPTQAQWERAARGLLKKKKYPWGNDDPKNRANFGRYTERVSFRIPPTKKVGSYQPNDFGLYDMIGNVDEWCLDRLDANDIHGRYHRTRGGSWFEEADELDIATVSQHPAADGIGTLGFRCVSKVNEKNSVNLVSDMSYWLYEKILGGYDSAIYSVSKGFKPRRELEYAFDETVKYYTGQNRSFEHELIRVYREVKTEQFPDVQTEDIHIDREFTLLLWVIYLEVHFEHFEKSEHDQLQLFRKSIIEKSKEGLIAEDGNNWQ